MKIFVFATPEQRKYCIGLIEALDPSKAWSVTVKQQRPRRSISQNNLLHQWLHIIADATGNELEDVKNALKDLYLPLKIVKVGKVERMVRPETSNLDVSSMGTFMDRVQAFAATELGITLPTPESIE